MGRCGMRAGGVIVTAAWLSGCALFWVGAGAGAGVGTYAYVQGELQREYQASLDRTFAATGQALQSLEMTIAESKKDQLGGEIDGRRADGTKVHVALVPQGRDRTLVKIRFGTFGDREASERLGNEIARRL